MNAKEFKELIKNIPNDVNICFECQRDDGEIINFIPKTIDTDFTIIIDEEKTLLEDVIDFSYKKLDGQEYTLLERIDSISDPGKVFKKLNDLSKNFI